MSISIIRTIILYFSIIALYRLMGKRQIGEMQPGELVLAIMVSDIATIPMQSPNVPLITGVIPILILMILEIFLSFLAQKSNAARKIITGTPNFIIANGKLVIQEMERLRFNIDDLFEQLRTNGYANIDEVEYAILETNGMMSIIPKSGKRTVTPDDLRLTPPAATLPRCIIKDGRIDKENLSSIGKDGAWLNRQLSRRNLTAKQVFLLCADQKDVTFIQKKE